MHSRTRGYLPHLESPQATYFVTFRLNDSLPAALVSRWKEELQFKKSLCTSEAVASPNPNQEYESKVQSYLDRSYGQCWLKMPAIATLVMNALRHFNNQRYVLHA